ncbi:MAG: hypothetical protein IT331_11635 [Anaerolineae bacterium]|nr:hypothetical protein [Anaerolineae bacterium]
MRKHLTAAVLYLALVLILTNPLAWQLWDAVQDKQDGLLNTWILAWVGHAFIADPANLFNTNIFYPYLDTLAFSEIIIPAGLFALPITLATNNPIFGYNLALLAMLWLDAFAMYLFVYDMTRRVEAGWIAGAVMAFNPFNLGNLAQLQLVTLGFLPLAMLCLSRLLYAREPVAIVYDIGRFAVSSRVRDAFLFALFFTLQALSSFYYALLAGFAVGLYLLWWLYTVRATVLVSLRRIAVPLFASFALIAVMVIPFLLPYFRVQRDLGLERRVQESEPFSASFRQFGEVAPENVLYGGILAPNPVKRVGGYPLDNLFPGFIALGLAFVGFIGSRARDKNFFLILLLTSFVLALGPRLYLATDQPTELVLPYHYLYDIFPPLRALRAPVRFEALVNFSLAAAAGLGTAVLLPRVSVRLGTFGALVMVALVALEYLSLPAAGIAKLPVANDIPEVYKWLADQPNGVIVEIPLMGPNAENELDLSTQYFTSYHWQKTPDGYSGFIAPRRGEVGLELSTWPSPRSIGLLRALDVKYVLDWTQMENCRVLTGPVGSVLPSALVPAQTPCVYEIPPAARALPELGKQLHAPATVAAGAPFTAYLILENRDPNAYGVKPTARAGLEAEWDNGATEWLEFPLPLVTSAYSVVPIQISAPGTTGVRTLRLTGNDALLGLTDLTAQVNVGSELDRSLVLPASVELARPLPAEIERGETLLLDLRWLPYDKINGYYSASVRLVDETGDKKSNLDRQPIVSTLLWQPDNPVADSSELLVPADIPPGAYTIQVLMYQADTDQSALLLDESGTPRESITLARLVVK